MIEFNDLSKICPNGTKDLQIEQREFVTVIGLSGADGIND